MSDNYIEFWLTFGEDSHLAVILLSKNDNADLMMTDTLPKGVCRQRGSFTSQISQRKQGSEPLRQVDFGVHEDPSDCCHLLLTGHTARQSDSKGRVAIKMK